MTLASIIKALLAMDDTDIPTEEPVENPTEEPVENPTEEPAEEPTEEPTEEPAEEPTEEPAEEPKPKNKIPSSPNTPDDDDVLDIITKM